MIRWACGLLFRDFRTVPMRATLFPVEFRLLQVLKRCSQRMRASSLWTLYKLIYLLIGAHMHAKKKSPCVDRDLSTHVNLRIIKIGQGEV